MAIFLNITAFIDWINDKVGKCVSYIIIGITAVIMMQVILRYFFNSPTIWADELSEFLYGGYFVLGAGYALRHGLHVRMDAIYSRLSLRKRALLDVITFPIFFIFIFVLVWEGSQWAWLSVTRAEITQTVWGPPIYPLKLALPIGAFLLLLQGLADLSRNLYLLITGKTLGDQMP